MKYLLFISACLLFSCQTTVTETQITEAPSSPIIGTWKLVYSDIKENDSVTVKDLTKSEFVKIINETHFAFFNQTVGSEDDFYGGGGTYTLNGIQYVESLDYIRNLNLRGYLFEFTVEFKEDSLIQVGLENVPSAGLKRYITEKYVRVKA